MDHKKLVFPLLFVGVLFCAVLYGKITHSKPQQTATISSSGAIMASQKQEESPVLADLKASEGTAALNDKKNSESLDDKSGKYDSRKKLLDIIRNGVVIIQTKAFASIGDYEADSAWSGTGFIVDFENGLIATNRHVVGETAVCTYEIKFSDGTKIDAHLKYFDPLYDFAFLSFDPKKAPKDTRALTLSDRDIRVNDTIFSMGNSAGDEFSTYKGTVFSMYENIGPFNEQSLKFSGITVGGASGSPVFGDHGEVLAIIYGGKFVSAAALPIRYVKKALDYLRRNETPKRRSIGVILGYTNIRDEIEGGNVPNESMEEYLKHFPEAHQKILKVSTRLVNSPAHRGLMSGDIIWKVDGQLVGPELSRFDEIINDSEGRDVQLHVYREGKPVTVAIRSYDLQGIEKNEYISFGGTNWFNNNERLRLEVGDDGPGIYISQSTNTSPFKEVFSGGWFGGIRPIRILRLDGYLLNNFDDLQKAIRSIMEKNKKMFTVHYLDFLGTRGFGSSVSADRQERVATLKYDAKFDSPKLYAFDRNRMEWNIKDLKPVVDSKVK